MDTVVVTLIPALLAPLAAVVPAFPAHGRSPVAATTVALLVRTVHIDRVPPAGLPGSVLVAADGASRRS